MMPTTQEKLVAFHVRLNGKGMNLSELASLASSRRAEALRHVKMNTHTIIIKTTKEGINLRVLHKNGCDFYNKTNSHRVTLSALNYLCEAKARPTYLNLEGFDHQPHDPILDILNCMVENVQFLAMAGKHCCRCRKPCLLLHKMVALKDIYCISPATLMFSSLAGVNELHIDATIAERCSLLLENNMNKGNDAQIFEDFKIHLTMKARVMKISDALFKTIQRRHLETMLTQMNVDELYLTRGDIFTKREQGYWPRNLRFAEMPGDNGRDRHRYWSTTEPKMKVKKLIYEAMKYGGEDGANLTEAVAKLLAYFDVTEYISFDFQAKSSPLNVKHLRKLCASLKEFKGRVLYFKCNFKLPFNGSYTYERLVENITNVFVYGGFTVEKAETCLYKKSFVMDVRAPNGTIKKLDMSVSKQPSPIIALIEIDD